jgi:dihydroxyacetone kinase DhaKLM complex PTS-EIIA-like component DhaM
VTTAHAEEAGIELEVQDLIQANQKYSIRFATLSAIETRNVGTRFNIILEALKANIKRKYWEASQTPQLSSF